MGKRKKKMLIPTGAKPKRGKTLSLWDLHLMTHQSQRSMSMTCNCDFLRVLD